jgi:hypothetical protein
MPKGSQSYGCTDRQNHQSEGEEVRDLPTQEDIACCFESELRAWLVTVMDQLAETTAERDALLTGVKSAYGWAQRKVWCKCKDTLGRTLVDAAVAGYDTPVVKGK